MLNKFLEKSFSKSEQSLKSIAFNEVNKYAQL